MTSHIISQATPLPAAVLYQIALASPLDEISNIPNAARSHIFRHSLRHKITGTTQKSMLFFVYQTTRHGPQNGFRLCLVHEGFHAAFEVKPEGSPEDDIDRLERFIPLGHMEVFVLGQAPPALTATGAAADGGD